MNFQLFFGLILICYLCYYLGTVAYDLMLSSKRNAAEENSVQEETVDISDEVKEFTPILITRPIIKTQTAAALKRKQTTELLLTGSIDSDKLVIKVEELSRDGKDCELGGLLADWKEYDSSS